MESVREMFDEMSLNVTAFLEVRRHPPGAHAACSARLRRIADRGAAAVALLLPQEHRGVSKLNFAERGPVTGVDLSAWESKSSGCALPEDLKALLQITDGLTLKWDANLHGAAAAAGGRGARARGGCGGGGGGWARRSRSALLLRAVSAPSDRTQRGTAASTRGGCTSQEKEREHEHTSV